MCFLFITCVVSITSRKVTGAMIHSTDYRLNNGTPQLRNLWRISWHRRYILSFWRRVNSSDTIYKVYEFWIGSSGVGMTKSWNYKHWLLAYRRKWYVHLLLKSYSKHLFIKFFNQTSLEIWRIWPIKWPEWTVMEVIQLITNYSLPVTPIEEMQRNQF